nr:RHS repeat-associated core domain-containing protein [Superficieibacter sp. 1612_C1]
MFFYVLNEKSSVSKELRFFTGDGGRRKLRRYLSSQSAGCYRTGDDDLYQRGHRLKRSGNTEYEYDAAGRMVSRIRHRDGYRPEREQFRWDSRDQLTGYSNGKGEQWEYRYDGSGRRTEKRCDNQGIRLTYLWDGDSIAEIREYRHDVLTSVRHLVFSGFELVSQQVSRERQVHPTEPVRWMTRTVHAMSEQTGRPLMLFNSAGEAVRRPLDITLWGRTAAALTADPELPRRREDEEADPGLLYAGQWRDAESGLCYNRFRYYEPESGMYLVSDPLGLMGGVNPYAYVPNPLSAIDPLGLATCPVIKQRVLDNIAASKAARDASKFPTKKIPEYDPRIRKRAVEDPRGHHFPFSFDKTILNTSPTIIRGGAEGYAVRGYKNGKEVIYNIIVKNGVINHRDMIDVTKWGQRSKSFGWPIDINDIPKFVN